jgi:hypothetical protein
MKILYPRICRLACAQCTTRGVKNWCVMDRFVLSPVLRPERVSRRRTKESDSLMAHDLEDPKFGRDLNENKLTEAGIRRAKQRYAVT